MATLVRADSVSRPRRDVRAGGIEDRYQPIFLLGRGGMGTVEVALERGPHGFERVVALKRLLPEQARDPRHKEMFLREARLAARLMHPNVVHAYAFGELYGELFIAMEYVEGEPLSRVLAAVREKGAVLDPALVAFILAGACDGLHAAHELCDAAGRALNVVHRDVSPQNVMIAYDGRVKILDFGVAKLEIAGHQTRTGEVKGKMAYMSPEQALGERLDRRSDLYSVGVVLFECLTGQRMWGEGTDLEVMRRLALEDPPSLASAMRHAPRTLVGLHARLVTRDPGGRPATARDAADELRALASAWPAPSAASLAQQMVALFGAQVEERRSRLTNALRETAPLRVESLRKTLDPDTTFEGTRTEPLIVGSERPTAGPVAERGRKGRGAIVAGMLVVVLVVAAVGVAVSGRRSTSAGTATEPATPSATATALATAAPLVTAPAPATAPALATAPVPVVSKRASARTPTPSSTRNRPPDVDPTPF